MIQNIIVCLVYYLRVERAAGVTPTDCSAEANSSPNSLPSVPRDASRTLCHT